MEPIEADNAGALTLLTRTKSDYTLQFHTLDKTGTYTTTTKITIKGNERFQKKLIAVSGKTYAVSQSLTENRLYFYPQEGDKRTLEIGSLPWFRKTVLKGDHPHEIQRLWDFHIDDDTLSSQAPRNGQGVSVPQNFLDISF